MELTLAVRRQVTQQLVTRWPKATKTEKAAMLDQLCATTGWHRDHARKMIRRALATAADGHPGATPHPPRKPREPVLTYDERAVELLVKCWATLDGPTGKRLRPALADLLTLLRRNHHIDDFDDRTIDAVLAMSPATIDRRLKPYRTGLVASKGRSWTRPGSLLKTSIPLKTWAEWDDTIPGFVQIDLVGHDGGDNNGEFCWTLTATDVCSGWTETHTVKSKGERIVSAALDEVRVRFPFAILGIHSDNGSEFINYHLRKWCTDRHISFSRGRAHRSNDQAHVEQKNWTVVRRIAGYHRYDTPRELTLLNQIWPLESLIVNLLLPQQRLLTKTRTGAKVRKTYQPAISPARRLLRDHGRRLTAQDRRRVEELLDTIDPIHIRHQVADLQGNLLVLARRRGQLSRRAKMNHVYTSRTKINKPSQNTPKPAPTTRASSDESTTHATRAS